MSLAVLVDYEFKAETNGQEINQQDGPEVLNDSLSGKNYSKNVEVNLLIRYLIVTLQYLLSLCFIKDMLLVKS